VKGQVTKGDWVVRSIDHVDEKTRTLYFSGAGREPGDPYLRHAYRTALDGSGLTLLTPENADHAVSFSPDGKYFVDVFSRVDLPTVSVLRSADDGRITKEIEKADVAKLTAMGWKAPEAFKAKAADGQTDLYALIWRPTNFDPSNNYPVIEKIYTGPQVRSCRRLRRVSQPAAGDRGARLHRCSSTAAEQRSVREPSVRSRTTISGSDPRATITSPSSSRWPRNIPTWT
jgi:dipeptidyl aminopeptidase/acylaminoacyl peptidase